jgi:hypothetical protein
MTHEEFAEGVARLQAFYRGINDAWVAEVYRKHGQQPAMTWARTVDWILEHRETVSAPTLPEIARAIHSAREAAGEPRQVYTCGRCKGDRFVPNDQQLPEGRVIAAVAPCPSCNRFEARAFPADGSICVPREPIEWTAQTVDFVMAHWDVDLDPSDPEGSRQVFTALWMGDPKPRLRLRKGSLFAKAIEPIATVGKPEESEAAPFV